MGQLSPYRPLFESSPLLEMIQQKDIDRLHREYQMFMKNARNIRSGQDLKTVWTAARAWASYFKNFISDRLLGQDIELELQFSKANIPKDLTKKVWVIIDTLPLFFEPSTSPTWDRNNKKFTDEQWDYTYSRLWDVSVNAQKPRTVYSKLQRIGNEAFKALDNFMQVQGGYIIDKDVREDEVIDGVKCEFHWIEHQSSQYRNIQFIKKYLPLAFSAIRKKGLGVSLKGLEVVADMTTRKESYAAGYYTPGTSRITLTVWATGDQKGVVRVVAHEVGHRYEMQMLPKENKKMYDNFRSTNLYGMTKEDGKELMAAFNKAKQDYQTDRESKKEYSFSDRDFLGYTISHLESPILKLILGIVQRDMGYHTTVKQVATPTMDAYDKVMQGRKSTATPTTTPDIRSELRFTEGEWSAYISSLWDDLKGGAYPLSAVKGYGGANELEDYAVAFEQYVTDQPMQPITRLMFKKVSEID